MMLCCFSYVEWEGYKNGTFVFECYKDENIFIEIVFTH